MSTLVILLVVSCSSAAAANRYDPRFRFRAINTAHFSIYFHQGEEVLARRLAAIAEDMFTRVSRQIGTPTGRVHVILVDQHDVSNGWATPVPFNTIEVSAAAPSGESTIGNTDDWLRLVLSHEYTHIVHLDKAGGWIGGLHHVFGRAPLLYPNLFLPLWQIEGIATYNESVLTGEGRVPAGDFRMIVDRAAASDRFDPIDRANGGLIDWPGGGAQYAYGAYFHQYLADRFGPESIAKLAEETSGRLPYFGAPAFRRVFKRSLGDLWDDFEANARAHAAPDGSAATRLTRHGFLVGAPSFGEDGHLFYSIANPHGFPALMELTGDSSVPRQVRTRYFGGQIGAQGGQLVFDQLELVHNVGLQSDVYAVDEDGRHLRRLTHLARAADPDLAHDGKTVVCTIQRADRRALGTFELTATGLAVPSILLSDEGVEYSSPRWSPDGRLIAVERRRLGGASEIVLVDVASGRARPIVSSRDGRNVRPNWLSPTTVLFASDRGGEPFSIYAVDVGSGAVRRLNGTGPSAQSPAVSPDGKTIVFVGYTTDGYDLFSLPLASASWTPVDSAAVSAAPAQAERPPASPPNTNPDTVYRPWRTLVPQFWMPVVESDSGELSAGATTGASDALGRHAYGATVAWTSSRLRPDWSIFYGYDRWWPTFFVTMSDDTDPWRGGEIRTREVNAGALFNIARVRWSQTVLTAIDASEDAFACQSCDDPPLRPVRRGAIRTGWSFTNAKSYGYSISRESGTGLRLTFEAAPEALGSDTTTSALTIDARAYRQLGPRHAAVALRAAGASAWGNPRDRRMFSAAGSDAASSSFDFGRGAVGLLRGFEPDTVAGSRVAVANLDYRFPLRFIQRGAGTMPVFLRAIHSAVFADAANAWDDGFRWNDARISAGAELSVDTVIGFGVPLSFTAGVAWRHDPVGTQHG
ncbi:MAG: BamA/TamA family outer membrane protein, partial [Vicinamibacterales bacterium]